MPHRWRAAEKGSTGEKDRICTAPVPMMIEKTAAMDEALANCTGESKGSILLPAMRMPRSMVTLVTVSMVPALVGDSGVAAGVLEAGGGACMQLAT